jgi:hypothetical protein
MSLRALGVAALIVLLAGSAAATTDPAAGAEAPSAGPLKPQPIPADLRASVERSSELGQSIYLQDKAAWVGTDALFEHRHSRDTDDIGGFLATREIDPKGATKPSFTVLFFTSDPQPRVKYRVRVPLEGGAAATVEEMKAPTQPDENTRVLIRARQTALRTLGRVTQPTNTVILAARPAIGEDGILVYLLASTEKPNVAVFGKHHRVLVSSDGNSVKRLEPLSKSILELPLRPSRPGSRAVELVVSHFVTDYPLETHVFVSLLNKIPVLVITPRGTWRVDGTRIQYLGRPELGAGAAAPKSSSPAQPPTCSAVCVSIVDKNCPNGPPNLAECTGICDEFRSGPCAEDFRALFQCTGPNPRYACDARGFITATGCETEFTTLFACGAGRVGNKSRK